MAKTKKIQRTELSYKQKLAIIVEAVKGIKRNLISEKYNCDRSTISKILYANPPMRQTKISDYFNEN